LKACILCVCGRGEEQEDDGGKSESPATFLLALESTDTVRKYCMKFHVDNNMMAALSNWHEEAAN
jgi:hypothetical protein